MNIVVFIKQVPDTNNVKWTENNNIDRTKTESIINPVDRQAVEAALEIKDKCEGTCVTAVTMGPKKAKSILQEAIATGVDEAVLLCDSKFAGSDTCATSKVLSAIIKTKFPNTDLIFFGQSAIDGETGQTGYSVAARLNLPVISHINEIIGIENNVLSACSENEKEKTLINVELPAVVCVNNYINRPRLPKIEGYIKAKDYIYPTYTLYDTGLSEDETGIKGSPTKVSHVFKAEDGRCCRFINTEDENCIINLANEIKGAIGE